MQAVYGDINKPKPGILDFKAKSLWDPWKAQEGITQHEARKKFMVLG
jgi:diazepam-binding inhibitor (GABA receptor modulator, acyl-CoA-binding protein)